MSKHLVLALFTFTLSACHNKPEIVEKPPEPKVGRFQLQQISTFRRDQFLLDTATGRMWTNVCVKPGKQAGDCAQSYWAEESVENISATAN